MNFSIVLHFFGAQEKFLFQKDFCLKLYERVNLILTTLGLRFFEFQAASFDWKCVFESIVFEKK